MSARTTTSAVTCANYHPPRMLPKGTLRTCTGVVIGGAIGPRVPTMTQDGERIQEALLDPRTAVARPLLARIAGAVVRWC